MANRSLVNVGKLLGVLQAHQLARNTAHASADSLAAALANLGDLGAKGRHGAGDAAVADSSAQAATWWTGCPGAGRRVSEVQRVNCVGATAQLGPSRPSRAAGVVIDESVAGNSAPAAIGHIVTVGASLAVTVSTAELGQVVDGSSSASSAGARSTRRGGRRGCLRLCGRGRVGHGNVGHLEVSLGSRDDYRVGNGILGSHGDDIVFRRVRVQAEAVGGSCGRRGARRGKVGGGIGRVSGEDGVGEERKDSHGDQWRASGPRAVVVGGGKRKLEVGRSLVVGGWWLNGASRDTSLRATATAHRAASGHDQRQQQTT